MNELAAKWWAERLEIEDKRAEFEQALIAVLNENPEWDELYTDYDPDDLLREALQRSAVNVRPALFTADDIFPYKTGIFKRQGILWGKEGYGALWYNIATGEPKAVVNE
jgi:hypothetical protein